MKAGSNTHALPSLRFADLGSAEAARLFEKQGCLKIDGFIPPEMIDALHARAIQCYQSDLERGAFIRVGHKRKMISLPIEPPFDESALFSAPAFSALMSQLLGQDHIIQCFSCVVSEPGAKTQHIHVDHQGLFGSALDAMIPGFAINLFIPLVALNESTGTTQMWPGSHRSPLADPEDHQGVLPEAAPGDAILMDYRVQHRGMANCSSLLRPVITLGFGRKWFLDRSNFAELVPLNLSRSRFEAMDTARQALFDHARLYF